MFGRHTSTSSFVADADLGNLSTFAPTNSVFTITGGTGAIVGSTSIAVDSDVTALATISGNGIIVRTADGVITPRELISTSQSITITNGDGILNNPTIGLGTLYLSDLADVSTSTLAVNDMLEWNGTTWVGTATTTFGLGDNTFRTLSDTINSYTAGRILFETGTTVTDDSNLVFINGNLGLGTTSPYARLSVGGSVVANSFLATSSTSTLRGLTLSNLNCSLLGNAGKITTDAQGNVICLPDNGGDGTGAFGLATYIQWNNGGVFGGSANFTWSTTTNTLTVTGTTTTSVLVATGATSTINALTVTSASSTVLRTAYFFQNSVGDCTDESSNLLYDITTGTFSCGFDDGAGVGSNVWSTTTNELAIHPTSNAYALLIGANSTTTTAKLEVRGGISAEYYSATSTTATSSLLQTSLTALLLNGDYITDLTGSGLMVTSNTLALDTSGNWTGPLMVYRVVTTLQTPSQYNEC